eukprot:TRINITY_DN11397_c0_g1_i1.p1 TRINITY_DN11397_c0_g1~~TRINITY_DN11397_c0_g1_i1.p1  ORF type:complete len:61 (-),score=1.70 TRINITY_DN11397_c0_g1_i1:46-228(-)
MHNFHIRNEIVMEKNIRLFNHLAIANQLRVLPNLVSEIISGVEIFIIIFYAKYKIYKTPS